MGRRTTSTQPTGPRSSDDPWARPHAIQALTRYFRRARVEHRQITPRDVGLRAIGHMGFFRRQSRDALWPCVSDWLSAQLAA
jgi:predicted alpha/beta hydrolase